MADRTRYLRTIDRTYQVHLTLLVDIACPLRNSNFQQRAIELLNSRKRARRPSAGGAGTEDGFPDLNPPPNLNGQSSVRGTPSILGMKQWLDELGHSVMCSQLIARVT